MKESNIEWTDSTINPTSGCDGCELFRPNPTGDDPDKTCYAAEIHLGRLAFSLPFLYAPKFNEVRLIPGRCSQAANWCDLRGRERPDKPWLNGKPRHIFVGDMGDIFSKAVSFEFLKSELMTAIDSKNGQRHVWQILTKRPERLAKFAESLGGLPDNVIAMTSVTSQRTADVRIPQLLSVRCKSRGLSIEPLLESVDIVKACLNGSDSFGADLGIDWVICGGESGNKAAPMHPDWARAIRDQCRSAEVNFFFKQWGAWVGGRLDRRKGKAILDDGSIFWTNPGHPEMRVWAGPVPGVSYLSPISARVGKNAKRVTLGGVSTPCNNRLLDGVEYNGMPEMLAVKAA